MHEPAKEDGAKGVLYLCATPIGNLEDMTFRAVRIMGEVPLIAAEDTRQSRKLLTHFSIHTPLTSYHEHNKLTKGPELIEHLLRGKDLLLVSDAGLPGIADPGSHLAALAIEAGIQVTPLPGANAALSALICSGLDTTVFTFIGFLPKTAKKRRERLNELAQRTETLLFYESPHRLLATLDELTAVFGEQRHAAAGRELTKKFEQFVRGTLAELTRHFSEVEPRGEFCLVVAGGAATPPVLLEQEPAALVQTLIEAGEDRKIALKIAAQQLNLSRRDVYQAVLAARATTKIDDIT